MRLIRRHDNAPRVEMTPLLDVVFLLLTFFIFTWVMMVRAQVVPMQMVELQTGGRPGEAELNVLAIDAQGGFYFNREPVTSEQLDRHLREFAQIPAQPTLYIAVEAKSDFDRAPLVVEVFERVKEAGIKNMAIVGAPQD